MLDPSLTAVTVAVISSVLTGTISAIQTTKALTVHIDYLRNNVDTNRKAAEKAHSRIDSLITGKRVTR